MHHFLPLTAVSKETVLQLCFSELKPNQTVNHGVPPLLTLQTWKTRHFYGIKTTFLGGKMMETGSELWRIKKIIILVYHI